LTPFIWETAGSNGRFEISQGIKENKSLPKLDLNKTDFFLGTFGNDKSHRKFVSILHKDNFIWNKRKKDS
jgi:hypothetical protein